MELGASCEGMKLLLKLKNWWMERIPEIERPGCPGCKQPMYWNRDKQDWACSPCDNYHFDMLGPYDDSDDYGYDEGFADSDEDFLDEQDYRLG